MNDSLSVEAICLEVFAKVSASVSHEIKNTLAIINENAGLLEDLAMLVDATEGVPVDRVQAAARTVAKQVTRSNKIMKDLNKFAHCGDMPVSQVQLTEILELMCALTARQAAMHSLTVTVDSPKITCTTRLREFASLLHLLHNRLYGGATQGSELTVAAREDDGHVLITFSTDHVPATATPEELTLAGTLGATCTVDNRSLQLRMPVAVDS